MTRFVAITLTVLYGAPVTADDARGCDVANGANVFQKCAVCHAIEAGAPHGAGPNLHGVAGRTVGKVDGFKFSKRMRESTATWDDEHLDAFVNDPAGTYKRNRMAFGGIKDPDDRRDLICFLKQQQ